MKVSRMISIAVALFVHLGNCATQKTDSCPLKQHQEKMTRLYRGRYANPVSGFDVLIPPGMIGRDYDDPLYQRGFVILFKDPEESLFVDGEPNSLFWKTAKEAAEADSSAYHDDGRKIASLNGDVIVMNGLKAYEITESYTCPGSAIQYSSITASAMGVNQEFVYTLRWEGKSGELENGLKIMRSLYSTWHFRKPTG